MTSKMYEKLKEYFDNTPKEILDRDWKELEHLNDVGVNVFDLVMNFELLDAAKQYAHECSGEFNPDIRDAFIHGAEWIINSTQKCNSIKEDHEEKIKL